LFDIIRVLSIKNIKMKPAASIIIPTYNSSELLKHTLNSILNQDMDPDTIETIVVDDGSSDDTVEVVESFSESMRLKYFFQEDRGNRAARARNIGIRNAENDVLVFIDAGVLLARNCISEHLRIQHKNNLDCAVIGYVYGFDQYSEELEKLKTVVDFNDIEKTICYLKEYSLFPDMRDVNYKAINYQLKSLPAPWVYFLTCNVSVSAKVLKATGGFDEQFDLNWGVEDLDLGYRIFLNKTPLIVGRLAEAIHYPHDNPESMTKKFQEETTNKDKFYEKYRTEEAELFLQSTFMELNAKKLANSGLSV